MKLSLTLVAVATLAAIAAAASPSCLDDDGKPVDYFHVLKAPKGNDTYTFDGSDLVKSKYGMGGARGAIPKTVQQIYGKMPKSHAFIMYNDETDDEKSAASHAHSKGVIMFDGKQGFWLIHSLPRYPSTTDKGYQFLPDNRFGQSFICLTLKASDLENIAKQIITMWPQVYDDSISDDMAEKYPDFASIADKAKNKEKTSIHNFKTKGGQNFTHFAKSKACKCNTFQDVLAPGLNSDLQVETWMNGAIKNKIPTSCKGKKFKYQIEDIEVVEMSDGNSWKETQDHSKWAITLGAKKKFVCYGDTNRQASQSKRGGGFMCINDNKLHKAMEQSVSSISNPCK